MFITIHGLATSGKRYG